MKPNEFENQLIWRIKIFSVQGWDTGNWVFAYEQHVEADSWSQWMFKRRHISERNRHLQKIDS